MNFIAHNPQNSAGNRSEQLRQRRTQQSTQRVSSATSRATGMEEPRPLRPVTVRNTTFGTPIRQRVATTNPRRQFYVALDTPGTELRLPALPVLHPGPRLASGLLAALCLIGLFSILFSSFFVVGTPQVKGLQRLTQAEIEGALDINNLNIVQLDAGQLREQLLKHYPILSSVSISVGLPNRLSVTVKERTPLFSWRNGDQEEWADASGVLFTPAGEAAELLTIQSQEEPPLYISPAQQAAIQDAQAELRKASAAGQDSATLKAAQIALEKAQVPQLPEQIDPVLLATAQKLSPLLPAGTTLAYSKDHGLGWQDPGGWEVFIGKDLKDFDQKYALYQGIIEQINGQGITPAIISVEQMDAPYYRLER